MERLASLAGISLFLSWCGLTWFGPSFIDSNCGAGDGASVQKMEESVSCEGSNCPVTARKADVPLVRGA